MATIRHYIEALRFPSYIVAPVLLAVGLAFGCSAIKYNLEAEDRQNGARISKLEEDTRLCTEIALFSSFAGLSALVIPKLPKLIDDLSGRV